MKGTPLKQYIGDGIYADIQNGELILTTEDGISVQNTVVLGPDEWESLCLYMERVMSTQRSGNG